MTSQPSLGSAGTERRSGRFEQGALWEVQLGVFRGMLQGAVNDARTEP